MSVDDLLMFGVLGCAANQAIAHAAEAKKRREVARQAIIDARSACHCQCAAAILARLQARFGCGATAAWKLLNPTSTILARSCVST